MNAPITQNNLYLLLPGKIGFLASWLADELSISLPHAIARIYKTNLYKELSREESKYWNFGPVYLYDKLNEELQFHHGDLQV